MATEISIRRPDDERLKSIEKWLRESVGLGSFRTIKNGFMGMDDWFYYDDIPDLDDESVEFDDDTDDYETNLIFMFRRASDATLFALKWTTPI